jgi:hypothetical protein
MRLRGKKLKRKHGGLEEKNGDFSLLAHIKYLEERR